MKIFFMLAAWMLSFPAMASITVTDDAGHVLVLAKPAERVVSFAPHVTELVFAAGGGGRLVGTVSQSDYPPAARSVPLIGDSRQIDIERLIALKPDLLVVWFHGSSARQVEQLQQLGIPIFYSEPRKLDDVADSLLRLGRLLGTDAVAMQRAAQLRQMLAQLTARYSGRAPVRVFYQVWSKPLYTLNGRHIVSDALRLCGGENIFGALALTAPTVNIEAVLLENPEAIVTGANRNQSETGLEMWRAYPALQAVHNNNLFAVDADLLNRAGPRLIEGATALCEKLDEARRHRGASR